MRLAALALATGLAWTGIGTFDPAAAQQPRRQIKFIRDAEIEAIIRDFARPILTAAGIDADAVTIALVEDRQINAFVAGGMNMFLHTGLLQDSDDASQLLGVIAHEGGHIAGGHLIRGRDAMENASAQAILTTILGIGAAVISGRGDAGMAAVMAGNEMARRNLLAFSRAQESAADQAGLTYLERSRVSAKGLLTFLEKLAGQELAPASRQSEYLRTHPLTRDRIDSVRAHVERSKYSAAAVAPEVERAFVRMRAKLDGYLEPLTALRRYSADDPTVSARYARAIAAYRRGEIKKALPEFDALIAAEPQNPYLHEMKGQILLENSRVVEAVPAFRRAVALAPESGLLRAALAQALLETNDPRGLDEAIEHLTAAKRTEAHTPFVWRLAATAWGRKGNQGMTAYALAEEALSRGDDVVARAQSDRAMDLLPYGSPGWLRAQDIRAVVRVRDKDDPDR